ncbi:MAG TPA: hypothetical protein VFW46_18045 [Stellaceae bacterium]|nr:hypothetical protein [Stellaceae bacterium]
MFAGTVKVCCHLCGGGLDSFPLLGCQHDLEREDDIRQFLDGLTLAAEARYVIAVDPPG